MGTAVRRLRLAILPRTSTSVEEAPKPPEQPSPPPGKADPAAPSGRWARRDTWLLLLVLLCAASIRVVRLAEPNAVVFDETYYAKDACLYLGHSQDFCGLNQATEQSFVHPPLGKWLISLGIKAFGYNSFGWRFPAAVFGAVASGLVFLLARKLFHDRWVASAAGFLAATDFLLIVQSRIAMLDIYLAFFVVLGFFFLAVDRQKTLGVRRMLDEAPPAQQGAEPAPQVQDPAESKSREKGAGENKAGQVSLPAAPDRTSGPGGREVRWRLAAGAAFGLALAIKWSAVLALAAAAVCALIWSLETAGAARSRGFFYGPARSLKLRRQLGADLTAFLLIPGLVYLAVYVPYLVDRLKQECPFTVPAEAERALDSALLNLEEGKCVGGLQGSLFSFVDLQDRMLDYHLTLKAKHTYQSKAWTWPLVLRPVAYFFENEQGKSSEVIALGNPVTWYAALLALVWLIRQSRKKWSPHRLVLLAWGAQYLPWLLVPRPLFLFYMTPVAPFMMIGLAAALGALRRRNRLTSRLVTGLVVLGAGAMLIYFYPVLAAVPIPYDSWRMRMWIGSFDCGSFTCGWI